MPAFAFWILFSGLLCLLAYGDVRHYRIPNRWLAVGLAAALLLHSLASAGAGFLAAPAGGLGAVAALKGALIGLGLFLPLYMAGAMGAGDVKLMAVVGAFLGPDEILGAAVAVLLAGGCLAVLVALARGVMKPMLENLRVLVFIVATRMHTRAGPGLRDGPPTVARLPYGVAIALGTLIYAGCRAGQLI